VRPIRKARDANNILILLYIVVVVNHARVHADLPNS